MRTARLGVLAGLAGLALLAGAACDTRADLERMIDQPSARAYEASEAFADGRSMRPPPAGTVSRDAVVGRPDYTEGGAVGQPPIEELPVPVTPELLARGRRRFEITCAACHGVVGDGVSVVASNMKLRKPPSYHDEARRRLPPGRIFRTITHGYGLMPAFGAHISVADRWAIVAYVQALQLSQRVPLDELPESIRSEARRSLQP